MRAAQSRAAETDPNSRPRMTKIALLRRVGLEWLEANAQEPLWPGMTVSKLCGVVSGTTFREYVEKMQRAGAWIDTACVHALGGAPTAPMR